MKRLLLSFLTLFLFLALSPIAIFGCACCAERGYHNVSKENFDEYMMGQLDQFYLGSAILYEDAGYPDTIVGLNPLGNAFAINNAGGTGIWNPSFRDEKNRLGDLLLLKPKQYELFMSDRNPLAETNSVTLYKEIRISGKVQNGAGFFKEGIDKKTDYELVLQGTGNMCHDGLSYKTYVLKVKGEKSDFSFFGKLSYSEDKIMQSHVDSAGGKPTEITTVNNPN
jgi:hypothetical protein